MTNRKQRVVLNGQSSSWTNVKAGVSQGSILGPLLFLIYINDLADGLLSNTKLLADDASVFYVFHNSVITTLEFNSNLSRIKQWPFQWKMSFNPDPKKHAQEITFSRKLKKVCQPLYLPFHLLIYFANTKYKFTNTSIQIQVIILNINMFAGSL